MKVPNHSKKRRARRLAADPMSDSDRLSSEGAGHGGGGWRREGGMTLVSVCLFARLPLVRSLRDQLVREERLKGVTPFFPNLSFILIQRSKKKVSVSSRL